MQRLATVWVGALGGLLWGWSGLARCDEAALPSTYELMINGESFLVELDRPAKLRSKDKPEVQYDVALRVAMKQRVTLNSVRFTYDWPARLADDQRPGRRQVRLRHELGYTMLLTDLGRPLLPEAEEATFKLLKDSVVQSLRESGMVELTEAGPAALRSAGAKVRGASLHYRDRQGFEQTCLVYLLAGPTFSCTCVVQYFDSDAESVKPRIQSTLESLEAVP